MPWLATVRVSGPIPLTLLSVWTQSEPSSCTAQLHRIATEVLPVIEGAVVLAGDLNAPGHEGSPSLKPHLDTVGLLGAAGLVSAFAAARDLEPHTLYTAGPDGRRPPALREPTYFHRRRQDAQWHIDHVFIPVSWASTARVTVGTYEECIQPGRSDHVPVIVDVAPPHGDRYEKRP
jgi:endonuclease/exonuclease/phosphatase family metal-dependent hydrolase